MYVTITTIISINRSINKCSDLNQGQAHVTANSHSFDAREPSKFHRSDISDRAPPAGRGIVWQETDAFHIRITLGLFVFTP